ncbi:MAG TPA: hypothetical protein VEZ71_24630 [Archangium sp.]|nr:hypothetical protein [Archangium sp.]
MRIARLQGWTLATARAQPFEDLVALAADYILEAEEMKGTTPAVEPPRPDAPSGRKRVTRTTQYMAT